MTASSLWREKNLLVIFYPFAFSTICQDEMCLVRDDVGEYATSGVQVVGVSTDTPFAHRNTYTAMSAAPNSE
ncbi:redoxin domain-containing protein [Saccharothrix sp. CB00851]|uniref:redoxin domain-containing protein n=1 Tax=Saccharothrix sp. CB00851 TaxID=1835005 RepID=UPI001F5245EF|nr:redoxin domain-containing protein [Saccharothrix sp. CB00851]